jgi:hypothetical protein
MSNDATARFPCRSLVALASACGWLATASVATAQEYPWTGATGTTGAGLGVKPDQKGRAWADLGFHTQQDLTLFSPLVGLGFQPVPQLELELVVPMAYASVEIFDQSDSRYRVGAPMIAGSYIGGRDRLRFKVGGALAYNPIEFDNLAGVVAMGGGFAMRGTWDMWLWAPERFNVIAPARVEYFLKPNLVLGGDAALAISIPTYEEGEVELPFQIGATIGAWVSDTVLVGGRLGEVWVITEGDSQLFLEPYFRAHFGPGFLTARFTLNLDDPYGFSFEEDKVWGLHLGGGAVF